MKKKPTAIPLIQELDHPEALRHALDVDLHFPLENPRLYRALIGLVMDAAETGRKFQKGRKPGSEGAIRKAIRRELKQDPKIKNDQLWDSLAASLQQRGFEFVGHGEHRFIDAPHKPALMDIRRFRNIAAEERHSKKPSASRTSEPVKSG